MQDCHDKFMEAIQEVDVMISQAENNDIKLGLTLSDISKLHHLQNKLQECKLLNTIYSEESRVRQLLNKKASFNLHVQEKVQDSITEKINLILNKFIQFDRLILYILNQIITKDVMRQILAEIAKITLGSEQLTILRQFQEKIECVSSDANIEQNLDEESRKQIYFANIGDDLTTTEFKLNEKQQELFNMETIIVIRATQRLASTTECTLILIRKSEDQIIPKGKAQQLKNMADLLITVGYDLLKENFHKDELISQVRSLTQFLIKNSPLLCQDIISQQISKLLLCHCQIIQSQKQNHDLSHAITENIQSLHIPVMYDNNVVFYVNMDNVSIDIITFADFISQSWQKFHHTLKEYKDKEFLYQIIEVSTQKQLVLAIDLDFNIIYQSGPVPSAWSFINLNRQKLENYQNLSEVDMDENYKALLINSINEVKSNRKSAIQIGQLNFQDKSVNTQVYVKKNELSQIVQFFIIFDSIKLRGDRRISTKVEERQFEMQQETMVTFKMDKLEKACATLQEMLHTNLTVFAIIDLLHEKNIQTEIENRQEKVLNEEIKDTFLSEYTKATVNTQLPAASYPRQSIKDIDTAFATKRLIKEDQLSQVIDAFQERQGDVELLSDYGFDISKRSTDIIHYIWGLFHFLNYEDRFMIEKKTFYNFLIALQEKYNQNLNPFHNFEHAFTVAHCCFYIIKNKLLDPYLDMTQQFASLLSGLCHDLEHTGRTNNFEVANMSRLAIRYNDESVLENHHASASFKLMQKDKYNILINLSIEQYQVVRKFMIHNILATDMKKHFALISQFEMKLKNGEDIVTKDEDKWQLSGLVVHTCDLTGPTKKFDVSSNWSKRIQQEFDNQVEEERQLGLPVTQYLVCQNLAKQELSFIRVIIKPIFTITSKVLDNGLKVALDNLEKNQKEWEKILNSTQ